MRVAKRGKTNGLNCILLGMQESRRGILVFWLLWCDCMWLYWEPAGLLSGQKWGCSSGLLTYDCHLDPLSWLKLDTSVRIPPCFLFWCIIRKWPMEGDNFSYKLQRCSGVSFICCLRNSREGQFSWPKPQKAEQEQTWEVTCNLDFQTYILFCFFFASTGEKRPISWFTWKNILNSLIQEYQNVSGSCVLSMELSTSVPVWTYTNVPQERHSALSQQPLPSHLFIRKVQERLS